MAIIRKGCRLLFGLVFIALLFTALTTVSAKVPYETYTYSYSGRVQISPNAFIPDVKITEFAGGGTFASPSDIIIDINGNVVVADTDNNRVVVLNASLEYVTQILGAGERGEEAFSAPSGVFSGHGFLYVADTKNARIVVFDQSYRYVRTFDAPSSAVFPESFAYLPVAVSVDSAGRMFVVSRGTNMGVVFLDQTGAFIGFIGAQRVVPNMAELFARAFMSEEQIARSATFIPMEYSNLTIDGKGFVYLTASSVDRFSLYSAVRARSGASTYAPIKKINTSGVDVLRRNGFFPPVGNVNFSSYATGVLSKLRNPSKIIEVCLLENGTYMLVDENQSKLFCYDAYGNLLYAFGGVGAPTGLFQSLASAAYRDDRLFALDRLDGSITVFNKTDYAKKIDEVTLLQQNREFDKASALWEDILQSNGNFDLAYLGIGKSQMELGRYREAMSTFRLIDNQVYYGQAFTLYRAEILEKYGMIIVFAAVLLAAGLRLLFGRVKKYNKSRAYLADRRTLAEETAYGTYVIFHPFKGFWDIKHQKRGSVRSATVILVAAAFAFLLNSLWSGFYRTNLDGASSIFTSLGTFLIPVFLWFLSNWCFTSLMDGKGSLKDIYISTCYALVPLILFLIPIAVLSHFAVPGEMAILSFFSALAYFWMVILIFFGSMTVHDYTLGKNILVAILTVAGMAFILFLVMIFFNLISGMASFVGKIIAELSFRM